MVNILSQFTQDPREDHLEAVYKVLTYLKGTVGQGLLFKLGDGQSLEMYTDSYFAGSIQDRNPQPVATLLYTGN